MFGTEVIMNCPVCKKNKHKHIGRTEHVKYKNEQYSLIYCSDCGNLIATQTVSAESSHELTDIMKDKTGKRFVKRLEEYFIHKDYDTSTPEGQIESEMFAHAKEIFSEEFVTKYEYEIKYSIQWLMSHTFNIPENKNLKSHLYENIKDEAIITSVTCY